MFESRRARHLTLCGIKRRPGCGARLTAKKRGLPHPSERYTSFGGLGSFQLPTDQTADPEQARRE